MLSAAANDVERSSCCGSGSGLPGLSALRRASAEERGEAAGQAGQATSEEMDVFTGEATAPALLSLTAVGQDEHSYSNSSPTGWSALAVIPLLVPHRNTNSPANTRTGDLRGRPLASCRWTLLARILWVLRCWGGGGGRVSVRSGFCRSP